MLQILLRRLVFHILSTVLIRVLVSLIGLSSPVIYVITSIEVVLLIVDLLYHLVQ